MRKLIYLIAICLLTVTLFQQNKIKKATIEIKSLKSVINQIELDRKTCYDKIGEKTKEITELKTTVDKLKAMTGILFSLEEVGIEAKSLQEINQILNLAEKAPIGSPFKGGYTITSPFGLRDERLWQGNNDHGGIDIIPLDGDREIYYTADGIIESYEYDEIYGWNMWVNHGDYKTHFAHLEYIFFPREDSKQIVGVEIKKGSRLGMMGASGFSYGKHLHYEIWVKGNNDEWLLLDPTEILKFVG